MNLEMFLDSKSIIILRLNSHHIPTGPDDYETSVLTPKQRIQSLERCETYRHEFPMIIIDSAADPRFVGGCPSGGYLFCHIIYKTMEIFAPVNSSPFLLVT